MDPTHLPRHGDQASAPVVWLDEPHAVDARLVGAKAANLATAWRAGLDVLPGFALTTGGTSRLFRTAPVPADVLPDLHAAWDRVSDGGREPLVVRSSSTIEDAGASSMAGRFTSVLGVRTWATFVDAVFDVIDSANQPDLSDAPMAVLVQPLLHARRGGVVFGADPVTGNADHLLVASVDGGPDALVSGTVDGATSLVTRRGAPLAGADLERRLRGRLARMATRAERAFGGPQDIEWALDGRGRLWMLQSRPITTPHDRPAGPRLGPGPLAETFPAPLSTLEEELWLEPLREGLQRALTMTGAASSRALRTSPIVLTIGGHVAADLDLLEGVARRRLWHKLDPRPGARRLRVAWKVGRLRAALPALAEDLVTETDAALLAVEHPSTLTNAELVAVLHNARTSLTALHGYEVLAGTLLDGSDTSITGAASALNALAAGRAEGLTDDEIIARDPGVLALVPPSLAEHPVLPPTPPAQRLADVDSVVGAPFAAVAREALRIRVRWVQELSARAARELAQRWAAGGLLTGAAEVRWMHLAEVDGVAAGALPPADLRDRNQSPGQPLPASFRLGRSGTVITDTSAAAGAVGAGGGQGRGPVHLGREPSPGDVLVVTTLDPALAPLLANLGGLVAETGSPLSHLAILARELGVATAVGVAGARQRLHDGQLVHVDGTTGEVTLVDHPTPLVADPPSASSRHEGASIR